MKTFHPNLSQLPIEQQLLWKELRDVPRHLVLYGGTAITLRLGHRESVDFDFFSNHPITVDILTAQMSFLSHARIVQNESHTATFLVERKKKTIKVSFFGGLNLGRVSDPECASDNGMAVAGLLDLAAQKVKVIPCRAEKKDYLDLDCLIKSGMSLSDALGAAASLYPGFDPKPTLLALCYFEDGDLPSLPSAIKTKLEKEATQVSKIPDIPLLGKSLRTLTQ